MKYLIVVCTWCDYVNNKYKDHPIAVANSNAEAIDFMHKLDKCLRVQKVDLSSKNKIRKFLFAGAEYEIYSGGSFADYIGICDTNDIEITKSINNILKQNRYRISFNDDSEFNLYCNAKNEKDAAIKAKKICSLPIASVKKLK